MLELDREARILVCKRLEPVAERIHNQRLKVKHEWSNRERDEPKIEPPTTRPSVNGGVKN